MKKIYYLATCDTCKRIIEEIKPTPDVVTQNIKSEQITTPQLEKMKNMAGSYEILFNRRAKLYREMDLKNKNLSDSDYKKLILEHYTFLKRPVIILDDQIFIGNSKKVVEAAKAAL